MRLITFQQLPIAAQNMIGEEQKTYLDEFKFFYDDGLIEAHYAGKLLAVWDGYGWQH